MKIKTLFLTLLMAAMTTFGWGTGIVNAATTWNTTGNYDIDMTCTVGCSGTYAHDMDLVQSNAGVLTGSGGYPANGSHAFHWNITSGSVSGNTITFTADYTVGAPGTTMNVSGNIAGDGTMSGTWSDNYGGTTRSGTWVSTSGVASNDTVTVTINKYVDGSMATASGTDNTAFPMQASWSATNIGSGAGNYELDADGFNSSGTPYQAVTSEMTVGANYSTQEVLGTLVANSCEGDEPYALAGYTSGNTMAEAQSGTLSTEAPNFTNLNSDKYVIVWNESCENITTVVSGGGGITNNGKPSGKKSYTFDVNIGIDEDQDVTGKFTLVNHKTKTTCEYDEISNLHIDNGTATFTASGSTTCQDAAVTIEDHGEPGAGKDKLAVTSTGGQEIQLTKISNGNLEVGELPDADTTMTFTASNSTYYNCPSVCSSIYGTGPISFTWDTETGMVISGNYDEVVAGTTYYNQITGGTVSGGTVNLTFERHNPNHYGPFYFSGTLSGSTLSGQLDGPYYFTASGATSTP